MNRTIRNTGGSPNPGSPSKECTSLEDRIRAIARASIDRMAAARFSLRFRARCRDPLSLAAFSCRSSASRKQDEPRMLKLTQELFASEDVDLGHGEAARGDPARHAKELFRLLGEFQAYFVPLMERRRREPKDDLASVIANAEDRRQTDRSFRGGQLLRDRRGRRSRYDVFVDLGWALGTVREPRRVQKLKADAGLIPRFVEEAIRWTTPVHHVMRTATADVELRGQQVARGDWLMLNFLSANRDEDGFRSSRTAFGWIATRHATRSSVRESTPASVSISHGSRCESSSRSCSSRLASVEIAGRPRRSASIFIGGPKTLPIRFKMN